MRALLCPSPRKLALVERPTPVAAPGAPLVRIKRAGVCGTDLHIFEGTQPYFEYPRVIGHELGGEIAAVAGPSRFRVGQQVAVLPYVACGQCVACRRGKPNCCQHMNVIGVHSDGGFADWLVVPEDNLVDAEGVSLDEAAMAEFLAIGAHAAERGAVEPGQKVVVVGAGPIGLATAIFARARGGDVTMLDTRADRLAFARQAIGNRTGDRGGRGRARPAGGADRRRFLRLRVRLHRLAAGDERRLHARRPWRQLRAGQHRAGRHHVLRSGVP